MRERIENADEGIVILTTEWKKLVEIPLKQGFIVEAFASADALIDSEVDWILRSIYSNSECQDLISEIGYQKGYIKFDCLGMAKILKSKTVINKKLLERIRSFKQARNLVAHSTHGEYSLTIPTEEYKSKKELDELTEKKSNKWLEETNSIYLELVIIGSKINPEYYFSEEFYKKFPRKKIMFANHPRLKD